MSATSARLRVLISAYACHPLPGGDISLYPGEAIGGWNLVRQAARFNDVVVLTHPRNREGLETAAGAGAADGARFVYCDLPRVFRLLLRVEFGIRIYYYLWQLRALFTARRLSRLEPIDLAHHLTFNNDWMPSFIGAFLGRPFVWGPVGGGQAIAPAFLDRFPIPARAAERFRTAAQWAGRNIFSFRRRTLRRASAILVCNRETRDKVPRRYRAKVLDFPVNGIEAADLAPEGGPGPRSDNEFVVLTAGRFHCLKAFDLAIEAFAAFAETHPGARLQIVGKGPEEERLHKIAQRLADGKATFLPWSSRRDLLARMRSADVFLFPSLRDGGGAVVVEAMASGIPVVVIDAGGPGAHIDGPWGIRIAARDPETAVRRMTEALSTLAGDPDLRARLGRKARERAQERFLWDRLGERMQEIYAQAALAGR